MNASKAMRDRKRTASKTVCADKRATEALARDTFLVGKSIVTVTLVDGEMRTEWDPYLPAQLTTQEWAQYRAGRDAFLQRVAAQRGLSIVVVEA